MSLHCDHDLERSNPIISQDILGMMLYYQTKSGCKQTSDLKDTVETVTFYYINPCCDLDLEDSKPIFLHDTPPHDNTPPYQAWLKMDEGSGDTVQTKSDTWTGRQTERFQCHKYHHNIISFQYA